MEAPNPKNLKLIDTYTTQERKEILGRPMEITTQFKKYICPGTEGMIVLVPEITGVKYL